MGTDSRVSLTFISCAAALGVASAAPEPPNIEAQVSLGIDKPTVEIAYGGRKIFEGAFTVEGDSRKPASVRLDGRTEVGARGEITQHIRLFDSSGLRLRLTGTAYGSDEAFSAETFGPAQRQFKMIRNSVGMSSNLRNNAIYDRHSDWELEGEPGTGLKPIRTSVGSSEFAWSKSGAEIDLTFRPRFYQRHKNVAAFKPWERKAWRGSVAGWCSWWAYFTDIHEQDVERVSRVFAEKLKDFGYSYIQIDDGYQSSSGGLPKDWLNTNDRFPGGLAHLSKVITGMGLDPALWVNVHFGDASFATNRPNLFVLGRDGKPFKGPWIDYGLDASVKEAIDEVVRPTYRALHSQGWRYVKVDTLRHLLYDVIYPRREYFSDKGVVPEQAFRDYLSAIRQEIGNDTYMLACWGVLPEAAGIADGCRLGGDGFGPSTLQQYTSWNNVVWRNDPDHCDIKPFDHTTGKTSDGEEIIRPVLVSMAGAQLLLSDKPEVYENDANLEGVKRSSPILFTEPGQLYDYDPVKTDHLKAGLRNDNGGANSGPIDADQRGEVCPWWMLDINMPFESWAILTRMNWEKTSLPDTVVKFRDLGLAPGLYSVFEFWSKRYLGDFKESFTAKALDSKGLSTYSIRKTVDHPQILSTSRHISQGAADLVSVTYKDKVLKGRSKVVRNDPYSIYLRVPEGFQVRSASFDGKPAETKVDVGIVEIKVVPRKTGSIRWEVDF